MAMLGLWEEAARDLHVASKLDYDEEIGLVLRKVDLVSSKTRSSESCCFLIFLLNF